VFNASTGTANGQIYNSIFYGNLADSRKDIYVFSTASTLSLRNSLFEDVSGNGGTDRANNIENGNPEFISINPSDANFLRLSANNPQSPAIDAGDNNFAAGTTDLAGNIRINNTTVDLGAYENLTVLPVQFISFNAKIENNNALLNWTVASEKDNDYYTIERSADGKTFTPLKRVPSKGNATSRTDYTFTDVNPLSGANYYRLSQTDYDGTRKELAVDYLNFELSAAPSSIIYPNPTKTEFSIRFAGSKTDYISVNVSDLTGKLIFNKSLQIVNDAATVNLGSNITPGNYIVSIKSGNAVERKVISIVP
ncbi:MAG: T9SS type A sorting domain-containing protein, partial [Pedobacter sp.]